MNNGQGDIFQLPDRSEKYFGSELKFGVVEDVA